MIFIVVALTWPVQHAVRGGGGSSNSPPVSEGAVLDAASASFQQELLRANAAVGLGTADSRGLSASGGTCPWTGGDAYECDFYEDVPNGPDLEWHYRLSLTGRCFTGRLDGDPEGFYRPDAGKRIPLMRTIRGCVAGTGA